MTWQKKETRNCPGGRLFSYNQHFYQNSKRPSQEGWFDVLSFSNWVNVVALTEKKEIILVDQFRAGQGKHTLEIPGGAVDKAEAFLAAAQRELKEETGYTSKDWHLVGEVEPNPAFMDNICQTFVAFDCHKASQQELDPLEDIEVKLFKIPQVKKMLQEGAVKHSLVVAGFHLFFNKYPDHA